MPLYQLPGRKPEFDVNRRYVRFRALGDDGFVTFDFAIGDPDLSVELALPLADYRSFCRESSVIYLSREQEEAVDRENTKWRFGQPGTHE